MTGYGLAMRAAGANARMARANGVDVGRMILRRPRHRQRPDRAWRGALFAQMLGAADVSMGIGVIVVALAAVICGTALLPSAVDPRSRRPLSPALLGSILYRFAVALALNSDVLGFTASDVNLVSALLVAVALYSAEPSMDRASSRPASRRVR